MLASLIPGFDSVKEDTDVQAVLEANENAESGQIQLAKRIKTMLRFESIDKIVQDLARSTASLGELTKLIIGNHPISQNTPSSEAMRLARTLQAVREDAIKLHSVLASQYVRTCHQRHEAKMFLDDRTMGTVHHARMGGFRIAITGDITLRAASWHESLFLLLVDDSPTADNLPSQYPNIRFSLSPPIASTPKHPVGNLCAAVSHAVQTTCFPTFYFSGAKQLVMSSLGRNATIPTYEHDSETLRTVLESCRTQPSPSFFSWKNRVFLALKAASSFLQFIQTPWVRSQWSAGTIRIPHVDANGMPDFEHPFLTVDFDGSVLHGSAPSTQQGQTKEDLLELGILLLETWHGTTIDIWVSERGAFGNLSRANRRTYAFSWLDDARNPPPDYYAQAVQFCIVGLGIAHVGPPMVMEWDDPRLWRSMCENVIEPLSKLAQIWGA